MIYGSHRSLPNDQKAYKSFRDLNLTVEQTLRTLEIHKNDFDAIIVRGISGMIVGAPVALIMGKILIVLRKSEENSHDRDGNLIGKRDLRPDSRILFLDDLIESGSTRRACENAITFTEGPREYGKVIAYYLYERDSYTAKENYDYGGEH